MLRINKRYCSLVWTLISLSFIVFVVGVNGALFWPSPYYKCRIFFTHVADMFMCGRERNCERLVHL